MKTKTLLALTCVNLLTVVANFTFPAAAQVIADRFSLSARPALSAFPVPSFRPTAPGQVIGVDAMPSLFALPNPDNGYAWFDACDADILTASGDVPVTCARMGIKPDRVEFGSRNFDGAPPKDVYIIRGRQVVAKFDGAGLTVYGTIRAEAITPL